MPAHTRSPSAYWRSKKSFRNCGMDCKFYSWWPGGFRLYRSNRLKRVLLVFLRRLPNSTALLYFLHSAKRKLILYKARITLIDPSKCSWKMLPGYPFRASKSSWSIVNLISERKKKTVKQGPFSADKSILNGGVNLSTNQNHFVLLTFDMPNVYKQTHVDLWPWGRGWMRTDFCAWTYVLATNWKTKRTILGKIWLT